MVFGSGTIFAFDALAIIVGGVDAELELAVAPQLHVVIFITASLRGNPVVGEIPQGEISTLLVFSLKI